jgi:hypothetical protein
VKDKLLVIGTADRYINVVNLNDPTKFYKTAQSPLKWQTRAISCFIDATGYAVGSIEGRCAINYVEDKDIPYVFVPIHIHLSTPFPGYLTNNVVPTSLSNATVKPLPMRATSQMSTP